MNTFDDDNELGVSDEPPGGPPRGRARRSSQRRSQRSANGPRPAAGSNPVLRLAGLVALGIAVVVGFVLLIGSCGSSAEGYSSYLAAMQPLAQDSASVGPEFATALATPGLTMQTFQSDLTRWSQQEQKDYLAAQRLRPPGPLQSAHAQALATFQLRYNSLSQLASTLMLAQQKHASASVAAAALASDAQLLSASDVVWAQLFKLAATQALTAHSVTGVRVPASRIVSNPDIVSAPALGTVYQRLGTPSSGTKVTGVHGSTLTGTSAVENGATTQLSTTKETTVAVGPNLVIDVVFTNSGDYPEVAVQVTLSVTAGGESVSTQRKKVAQIAAGAQATVSFTNIQVPESALSHSAAIYVKIKGVPGETQLGDNAASYPVFFRLAPS
jgi:hypothetical protein